MPGPVRQNSGWPETRAASGAGHALRGQASSAPSWRRTTVTVFGLWSIRFVADGHGLGCVGEGDDGAWGDAVAEEDRSVGLAEQ